MIDLTKGVLDNDEWMEIGDESSCQEFNTVFHKNHFALILPRPSSLTLDLFHFLLIPRVILSLAISGHDTKFWVIQSELFVHVTA